MFFLVQAKLYRQRNFFFKQILNLVKKSQKDYTEWLKIKMWNFPMKVKASVKADPGKGDKIVRRKGRLYVINKRDPNRKQRQKGPAKKK